MTTYKEIADNLQHMLLIDEGEELKPYKCPAGKITIGIGRNLTDNGITKDESRYLFNTDVSRTYDAAIKILGTDFYSYSKNRQCAILNLIFNLGETKFRKFTNTIQATKNKNWELVGQNLRKSLWFKQVGNRGNRVVTLLEKDLSIYED